MDVIDRIYEAALVPDCWSNALAGMAAVSGATVSAMFLFGELEAPRGVAFNVPQTDLDRYLSSGWANSPSTAWSIANMPEGFTVVADHLTADQLANDEGEQLLARLGVAPPMCSTFQISSTEIMGLLVAQPRITPRGKASEIGALNALRPHFARSGVITSRLGLERARATVGMLEGLGLAAAVINRRGRVIASNALLDRQNVVIPTAFGGVALSDRVKNVTFSDALCRAGGGGDGPSLSVPLPSKDSDPPLIVHLLPVRGLAHDLFSDAHVLMVVSQVTRKAIPQPELLYGLFDLTPAEARLTRELLDGGALPEIAARVGLSHHTLRIQLRSIMAKTGTRRQAELTQLLAAL